MLLTIGKAFSFIILMRGFLFPNSSISVHIVMSNLVVQDIEEWRTDKIYTGRHRKLKFIVFEQLK